MPHGTHVSTHDAVADDRNDHIRIYVNGDIVHRGEALMLDPFGFVNTTNACNFFIVRDGEVWTSTGDYCMNGITRQKVIDPCRANDIAVFEKNYSLVEAYSADEAFLTGTFGAQTPVFEIDGREIGGRKTGPVFHRIRALYKAEIAKARP